VFMRLLVYSGNLKPTWFACWTDLIPNCKF
jgi:hypothetical protein